jgi:hypothetical protein
LKIGRVGTELALRIRKIKKELEKGTRQLTARLEVEAYEAYMEDIRTLHKEVSEKINWLELKESPAPFLGDRGPQEEIAMYTLENYKPAFFIRLFRLEGRQRKKLEGRVKVARENDQEEFRAWQEKVTLATAVLEHDEKAYNYVLEKYTPLEELQELGSDLEFKLVAPETLMISFRVNENSVIPTEVKSMTPTGRLSVTKMPSGKFNEAYQDYVCSTALRMAREAFAVLPIHTIYLNVLGNILDTSTGFEDIQPILSVKLDRATLERLNLDQLDPSDSMQNFEHNMRLMKTKGFQAVEKIEL